MTVKEGLLETHPPDTDTVGMLLAVSTTSAAKQKEVWARMLGKNLMSVTSCQTGISIPLTSEALTFEGLA